MPSISMLPPVPTKDADLYRVQDRFETPLNQLIDKVGSFTLVQGISLANASGDQTLIVKHNLGRAAKGAFIGNSTVKLYGPWGLQAIDNNTALVKVNLPATFSGFGSVDVWVY